MLGSFVEEGAVTSGQTESEILPLLSAPVAGLHPTLPALMADTKLSPLGGRNREKRW